jgi:hypothetical protein
MAENTVTFLQKTYIYKTKLQTCQLKYKHTNNSGKTAQHSTFKLFLCAQTFFQEHGTPAA